MIGKYNPGRRMFFGNKRQDRREQSGQLPAALVPLVLRELQPLPFDLIQEWTIARQPYRSLGQPAPGEQILHAIADAGKRQVVGVTEGHLFVLDLQDSSVERVGEVPGRARLALGAAYGRA